jgi:glycosyltransferase involved in cell wall biosynthesis
MEGLNHHEDLEGIQVRRVSSLRRIPYQAGLLSMLGFILAGLLVGSNHIRSWRPDVIHVHFAVPAGVVAWILSRMYDVPYILTAHLGDIPGGVPTKTSRWFRWIYPFTPRIWQDADQVVAVSEYSRQLALKYYQVDINVIPNGVNLNVLAPGIIEVSKPPQITFAGRFVSQKNPITIVQIMAQLRDLDWQFSMIGDGPLRSYVEEEIENADLQDRFTLTGWVTPDEVITFLRNSDVLFMPSSTEGLPIIGVQALAMGLAIVGSRVGGFVDIVDQGKNGFLYPPEDTEAMQIVLRKFISNPEELLAFRKQSRKRSSRFNINRVVDDYVKIFEKVASN